MNRPKSSAEPRRIPELDGLRGIAIGLVLGWHYAGMWFDHPLLLPLRAAWSGVDLFFVLSGFLIGGILLDEVTSNNYFKAFYVRRFYRILPLYLLFVLIVLPLESVPHKWSWLVFLQNVTMYLDPSVFQVALLSVTWSLAVEEQFYLLLPLTVRILHRRWLLAAAAALWVLASPLIRFAMHNGGAMEWIMFPSRGDSLGLGVLCAILLRSELWHSVKGYAGFIAVSAVIWLTAAKLFIRTGTLAAFSPKYTCFGLVYASVLLLALTRRFHLVSAILNSPPLQFLGRVSYFVYLAHLAIREAAFRWIPGFWMPTLVGCVVTLGLSELSWRVLEKPLVKRGHRTKYIV